MSRLRNGQPFPPLEVPAVGGGTVSLPGDLAGSYGVVLAPDGTVRIAVYSSDAIGRLVADNVAGLVTYLKSQQPA